jgi:hypothetical protein
MKVVKGPINEHMDGSFFTQAHYWNRYWVLQDAVAHSEQKLLIRCDT